MKVTPDQDSLLHTKLPIDKDEVLIAVYKHHPIAYIIPILLAFLMILVLSGLTYSLTSVSMSGNAIVDPAYKQYLVAGVGIFSFLILVFSYIPVWIKMQDQLVLTDEALLQTLQTSLFSDKISQLSLQHVADVTVRAGFWGNLFGYGHITIETPGEQDNYEYGFLPNASSAAREISEAHENFISALESGRMHTDFRSADLNAPRVQTIQQNSQPQIAVDSAEYQEFLKFQQMKQQAQSPDPTRPSNQQ